MNQINVNVQDSQYVRTNTINNVVIRVSSVELFKSISVIASLFENTTLVDNKFFTITDAEYAGWGTDDKYIVDLVLNKLGLSEKVTVTTQ